MDNKVSTYLHLVWGTWDRLPTITPEVERLLHRAIIDAARNAGCRVLACNGTVDHVHLLVTFPTTIAICDLAQRVKGSSSHLLNETAGDGNFRWQRCYGVFTVSPRDSHKIASYVKRQKEHHGDNTLDQELEVMAEE